MIGIFGTIYAPYVKGGYIGNIVTKKQRKEILSKGNVMEELARPMFKAT